MIQLGIRPVRGVAGLLQEHGIAGDLGDVDRYAQTLAGEDGVHDLDVLASQIARDGEDEDARVQGWGGLGGVLVGLRGCGCVCGGGGEGEGEFVCVG